MKLKNEIDSIFTCVGPSHNADSNASIETIQGEIVASSVCFSLSKAKKRETNYHQNVFDHWVDEARP